MNYYEHHIGDYAEATAHLSFVEDAAYTRLIRKYYATEKPLPADLKQVQRLVGARTKEEKNSVEAMLKEFFILMDDGWHNERCDFEIAKYQDGEPEREVKKANETNRLKKHREERALLFMRLTAAGHHAAWNIPMGELRELVARLCPEPETEIPPLPETAPATPATATQTPDTNTQTPDTNIKNQEAAAHTSTVVGVGEAGENAASDSKTSRNIEISILLRARGIRPMTASHPLACAWADDPKVTDTLLLEGMQRARDRKPEGDIHPNYLKPIVDELLNPPPVKASKPPEDAWWKSDKGIERKGRELGMFPRGTESYGDFKDRIFDEIRKREEAAA